MVRQTHCCVLVISVRREVPRSVASLWWSAGRGIGNRSTNTVKNRRASSFPCTAVRQENHHAIGEFRTANTHKSEVGRKYTVLFENVPSESRQNFALQVIS